MSEMLLQQIDRRGAVTIKGAVIYQRLRYVEKLAVSGLSRKFLNFNCTNVFDLN